MNVLVDTNVLLDVIVHREPFYAASSRVWALAEARYIRGMASAISFNNVYYLSRRQAGKATALKAMRLIRGVFDVVAVDDSIIEKAIESGADDFEDAIQYYCALSSSSEYLVTRDRGGFPDGGPVVLSPEEFLKAVAET